MLLYALGLNALKQPRGINQTNNQFSFHSTNVLISLINASVHASAGTHPSAHYNRNRRTWTHVHVTVNALPFKPSINKLPNYQLRLNWGNVLYTNFTEAVPQRSSKRGCYCNSNPCERGRQALFQLTLQCTVILYREHSRFI